MSGRPWMPLYIADYLADTERLTTLQHGAYLLLIMHYWMAGGLPADDGQLARITRSTLQSWIRHTKPALASFFRVTDSNWHHKRIDQELAKRAELSMKRAVFGSRGGATIRSSTKMRPPLATGRHNYGSGTKPLTSHNTGQANASSLSSKSYTQSHKKERGGGESECVAPQQGAAEGEIVISAELAANVRSKLK
jgi:uncharacterized protein YdaU (DUF1376 family)